MWYSIKSFRYVKKDHTLHRAHNQSSTTLISADTIERLDIKPHCFMEIGEFSRRKFSTIILTIGRTAIGLYPDGSEEFVPFGIRVILLSFQSVGYMPEEIERLNNLLISEAMQATVYLSINSITPCRHRGIKLSQKLKD